MPIRYFLATVEVRVAVNVPEDFTEDDLNGSLEVLKIQVGKNKVVDVQTLDVSSEEVEGEDENDW